MASERVVLEHLEAIRSGMDRLHSDMREVRRRLGFLEGQYAYLSIRLDRMDERLEHLEGQTHANGHANGHGKQAEGDEAD